MKIAALYEIYLENHEEFIILRQGLLKLLEDKEWPKAQTQQLLYQFDAWNRGASK